MKTKLKRYPPKNYILYTPEIGDYKKDLFDCYVDLKDLNNPKAMFYIGKRSQPDWHFRFRNVEEMKKRINEGISRLMSWEDMKEKRKQERKSETNDIKVGDIFYYSWGYDQTNVDFYQVIKKTGKTFIIRPICGRNCGEAPSGSMSDYVIAVKDSFVKGSEPILKRNLSMKFGCLSKTDNKQKHFCSWYA